MTTNTDPRIISRINELSGRAGLKPLDLSDAPTKKPATNDDGPNTQTDDTKQPAPVSPTNG